MKVPDGLGQPVDDRELDSPQQQGRCGVETPQQELAPPPAPKRRIWPLIVVAVFLAGALAGWLFSTVIASRTPELDPTPPDSLGIASTAELFASLYLAGTSGEAITQLHAGQPPPPSGTWVNQAAAVAIRRIAADRWEVTVAVDSLEARDGLYQSVPLGFYLVPMAVEQGRAVAIGAPARVPAPDDLPAVATTTADLVPEEQSAVAERFIELHLRGDPEAFRLLVNPTAVSGFAVPPYESVVAEVTRGDGPERVIVTARATTADEATHPLEYLVTLQAGESGWLVAGIGSVAG